MKLVLLRKKLNLRLVNFISQMPIHETPSDQLKRLAFVVSLVNAKPWENNRSEFGYSNEEIDQAIEWAIETLLQNVK
jgi:hypothetical protein